jgi:hypothetical protein
MKSPNKCCRKNAQRLNVKAEGSHNCHRTIKPFFFNLCGGTLGTAATTGLLYQPQMIGDGDRGEIGEIKIGRGNRSTRRKPALAPLRPPQIQHD